MIGLTGSEEDIKKVAKVCDGRVCVFVSLWLCAFFVPPLDPPSLTCPQAYRVYFSKPTMGVGEDDYLVDHTIIMYLFDPEGNFVAYYGQNKTAEEAARDIARHMDAS